jgi:hypothetical protein
MAEPLVTIALGLSGVSATTCVVMVIWIGRYLERIDQLWKSRCDEIGRLEDNQNSMADFQIRRAMMEAQQKGLMHKNSPLRVAPEAKIALSPLAERFREFYLSKGWPVGDIHRFDIPTMDQFIAFERNFGKEITDALCMPFSLNEGACLIAAIEYARTLAAGGDPFPESHERKAS